MNPFDSGSVPESNQRNPRRTPQRGEAALPSTKRAPFLACDVVEPDVVAYFDGEADDQAALRARRHLDACAACARMWRDWGDSRLLLRSARLPEMPVQWPASLIQRARLQALLPALFDSDDVEDAPEASDEADLVQPPRELRDTILARTTRVRADSLAAPRTSPGSTMEELRLEEPNSRRLVQGRRFRMLTRACVPALAAWMFVLASAPALRTPSQSPSQAAMRTGQAKGMTSTVPVQAGAPRPVARPAWTFGATAAPSALARVQLAPGAKLAQDSARSAGALSLSPLPTPTRALSAAASNVQASAQDAEDNSLADALEEVASEATDDKSGALPQLASAPRTERRAPATRNLATRAPEPAPDRAPLELRAAAPAVNASSTLSRGASSVASGGKDDSSSQALTSPSAASSGQLPATSGAKPIEGVVEHEPLDVAHALNDARPTELGDAIDAYAATYVDESEASL